MALITQELPPLQAPRTMATAPHEPHLQVGRCLIDVARETGRFALVLGIFGAIIAATLAIAP